MLRKFMVTALLSAAVAAAGVAAPAASDAAPGAGGGNCVSVLTSYYGPQMQVDDAVHVLRHLAAQSGMTFGQVARKLASNSGDVTSCLAVLGLPS
jgi:hypothetical protein